MAKDKESFASKLKKLEDIVAALETGKMELETSLEEYKKGINLSRELKKYLQDMENKITILTQDDDPTSSSTPREDMV